MNNKILVGIILVLIVIGGYFAYTKTANKSERLDNVNSVADSENQEVGTVNPSGKKIAFDAFVRQGGSYQCTVHQSVNNVDSVGTVYVANGNMSGQFDTTVQGQTMTSNMIMKDGYMYSWSSMSPNMGFKMAIAANTGNNGTMANAYADTPQFGDYDCKAWSGDPSKFTPPATVKFTEMKLQ